MGSLYLSTSTSLRHRSAFNRLLTASESCPPGSTSAPGHRISRNSSCLRRRTVGGIDSFGLKKRSRRLYRAPALSLGDVDVEEPSVLNRHSEAMAVAENCASIIFGGGDYDRFLGIAVGLKDGIRAKRLISAKGALDPKTRHF